MGDPALIRIATLILGYVLLLLVAFVGVYLLLHRASREERDFRRRRTRGPSEAAARKDHQGHNDHQDRRDHKAPNLVLFSLFLGSFVFFVFLVLFVPSVAVASLCRPPAVHEYQAASHIRGGG